MKRRRNAVTLALTVVVGMTIAGCVQHTPDVIPTSAPTSKPVFATDAAALAAAKKALNAYLKVSDEVGVDGGDDTERFSKVVTKSWLPKEKASAANLSTNHRKQEGSTAIRSVRLQQRSQHLQIANVSVYACLDLSKVVYVDTSTGLDPTQPTNAPVPISVNLTSSHSGSTSLLIERITPWSGSNFCPQS